MLNFRNGEKGYTYLIGKDGLLKALEATIVRILPERLSIQIRTAGTEFSSPLDLGGIRTINDVPHVQLDQRRVGVFTLEKPADQTAVPAAAAPAPVVANAQAAAASTPAPTTEGIAPAKQKEIEDAIGDAGRHILDHEQRLLAIESRQAKHGEALTEFAHQLDSIASIVKEGIPAHIVEKLSTLAERLPGVATMLEQVGVNLPKPPPPAVTPEVLPPEPEPTTPSIDPGPQS